jgi:hypothetical protein
MDKKEETLTQLKEAIREARECLKDFKSMRKEWDELSKHWDVKVEKQIKTAVHDGLNMYHATVFKASREAEARVFKKFDKLEALLLGEKDDRNDSIEDLIRIREAKKRDRDTLGHD